MYMIYITLFTTLLTVKMLGFQCSYRGPWQLRLRQPERPGPRYKLKKYHGLMVLLLSILLSCCSVQFCICIHSHYKIVINYFNLIVCWPLKYRNHDVFYYDLVMLEPQHFKHYLQAKFFILVTDHPNQNFIFWSTR